ncbi:MAG: HTH domain-containing protein, partial [Proteiniphilum sp.]|nr:HTH domain-containing protein [Proteiniphilum sp.]
VTEDVTEKRRDRILELLSKKPSITTEQIAEILSVSKITIIRDIDKLKRKGQIEYIGSVYRLRRGWLLESMPIVKQVSLTKIFDRWRPGLTTHNLLKGDQVSGH